MDKLTALLTYIPEPQDPVELQLDRARRWLREAENATHRAKMRHAQKLAHNG